MDQEVLSILKRVGSVITDSHFVGTSGRHMSVYVNKDALFPHTPETSRICELFAEKNKDLDIDIVVGPALGGIILSQWTAFHLSRITGKEILSVYTEKVQKGDEEDQVFRLSYDQVVKGKNVLVLEDTTSTGGSVKKVVNAVREVGGNVVQVCVMVNRDPKIINSESIGAPFSWLAELSAESYPEEECPLCKAGVPVNTTVGHGKKFLEKKAATT
ncbi:MAG: phosphoribosyltransferase family protein [Patescibacteria group bacterium]